MSSQWFKIPHWVLATGTWTTTTTTTGTVLNEYWIRNLSLHMCCSGPLPARTLQPLGCHCKYLSISARLAQMTPTLAYSTSILPNRPACWALLGAGCGQAWCSSGFFGPFLQMWYYIQSRIQGKAQGGARPLFLAWLWPLWASHLINQSIKFL